MSALAVQMTAFSDWLAGELARRGSNRAKLAAGIESKSQTVAAWFNEGRIPSPEFCRKVARYLHVPEEDVLRLAGHLSGEVASDAEMPDWASMLPSLTPKDAEFVGRLVADLVRKPVNPAESPDQGAP